MSAALWHNDVRHFIILLNVIVLLALAGYVIYGVLSPRRAADEARTPANQTPFFEDEELESRRLERVQGWALLFAAIVAVALPLYWLREPTRQKDSTKYFDKNAVARGATLFANSQSPAYDAAVSLQCANCHGLKGEGGTAPTVVNGKNVSWKAPPLNTELLRFSEDEVRQIITYGRPGTPMQPWGVAGGGPKNDQSINDLIAYIKSITLKIDQAKKITDQNLADARSQPADGVKAARSSLADATKALATARSAVQKSLKMPGASDAQLKARCDAIQAEVDKDVSKVDKSQATACGTYLDASSTFKDATDSYAWALEWQKRRANVSEGQLLFETNCARCHTQGWSIFDPSQPNGTDVLGLSGGGGGLGGGIGFNLRGGDTMRRFGTDEEGGFDAQVEFVFNGSEAFKPYGLDGIGSGRMPGFGAMMTKKQIQEVVAYERYCLEVTNYNGVTPPCDTSPQARVKATTTTTAKG
jgi:mono/diheme cytochrome c family protein